MTAAYGLPDHLFSAVAHGVQIADTIAEADDGVHNGLLISKLASKWDALCKRGYHYNLLSTAEAGELLAVLELAIEYAEMNNYGAEYDADDFPEDVAFTGAAEEIVFTLEDIIRTGDRIAA